MSASVGPGTDVRHYLDVLRRRRWIVILAVAAVVFSALAFSFIQTPVYAAHARVLVESTPSVFMGGRSTDPVQVNTEIEVLSSEAVKTIVQNRLGDAPNVSATAVGDTTIMDVAVESTSPSKASRAANAYAEAYLDYRRQRAANVLNAATKELSDKIAALDKEIAAAANPPAPPPSDNPPAADSPPAPSVDRDALVAQRSAFKERYDQLQVEAAVTDAGGEIAGRATVPTAPVRPTTLRNVVLGAVVGLAIGLGLAFVADQLDDSLEEHDDVERATDLPVLGVIPADPGWKNPVQSRLVTSVEPGSPSAEAYRTLRTPIQFLAVERSTRALQVTSPAAGDGKTATTVNLAVVLARAGQQVAVVSCDLRRPRVHDFLGVSNRVGFTSVLLGQAALADALQTVPGEDRLQVLASGPIPPNPSELLSSRHAGEVISALKDRFDAVLVDCPPVLPVTDAAVLSAWVDGTLIVISTGVTKVRQLTRAVGLLRQVGAPLVGVVMNNAPHTDEYGTYPRTGGVRRPKARPPASPTNGAGPSPPSRAMTPSALLADQPTHPGRSQPETI